MLESRPLGPLSAFQGTQICLLPEADLKQAQNPPSNDQTKKKEGMNRGCGICLSAYSLAVQVR